MNNKSCKSRYKNAVSHALAGFQLIEQSLKEYLAFYYTTLELISKGKLTFNWEPTEFSDAPLGRLCSLFSKYNDNKNLIDKIKKLKKHRDELAHTALALLYEPNVTEEEFKDETDKYMSVSDKNIEILAELRQENLKVLQLSKVLENNG